jgi:4-amino-4-deoxy-L-arabinose transferase-like glycosyltransferase
VKLRLPQWLKRKPTKWQVAVAVFALTYAVLVTLNLASIPMNWDEATHFNGALLLSRGQVWDFAAINSFYPPLFNVVTAGYYAVLGASVLSGRLVTVTFSVLSIFVVYKLAKQTCGEKTAVVSAVLFGVMPGIVWLSSMSFMETMLVFVFSVCMLFFFNWLQTNRMKDLGYSFVALAVGVAVKYQIIVIAPLIMLVSVLVFGKAQFLKNQISTIKQKKLLASILLVAASAAALLYALYASGILADWVYAMEIGNPGQTVYSNRFPTPIFYFIEMVLPYFNVHPISVLLYALGLAGLAFFAYRRKPQDKFLLIWFFMILVVFTVIPNRQWRYVTPLFPVLAISATALVASAVSRAKRTWRVSTSSAKKLILKASAAALLLFTVSGVVISCWDAYSWTAQGQLQIPIAQASEYVAANTPANSSVMVLCPYNLFNRDMVWFYLNAKAPSPLLVYQFPVLAVDAYTWDFNFTEIVNYCQNNRTRTVMLYEYGGNINYFGSQVTEATFYEMLNSTGRFTLEEAFGKAPNRIFVLSFK